MRILTYRPEFRSAFERLNREWLESYALLEAADVEYLLDPEGRIVSLGGQIFFAVDGDDVVGTCAAIYVSSSTFELAKLTVAPTARRRGIARLLAETVLQFARDAGARHVELSSNSLLPAAIHLYESLGFQHTAPPTDIRYHSADVYMALGL